MNMKYFEYHNTHADLYAQRLFGKNYTDLDMFTQDALDDHLATEWMDEGLQK